MVVQQGDGMPPDTAAFGVRVLRTGDRTARVLVTGELDLASSPRFEQALTTALDDADEVVVDLSEVTFIDSTGLSAILAGVSASQLGGRKLAISSLLAPQARKLFALAGMEHVLPLVDE